jgi:hypothetical protein
MRVSNELQVILRSDPETGEAMSHGISADTWEPRWNLQTHLRLRSRADGPAASHARERFLTGLLVELEDVVKEGPAVNAPRAAREITERLTEAMCLEELVALVRAFGFDNQHLPGGSFRKLTRRVRAMFVEHMSDAVAAMLGRWKSTGVLEVGVRRRQRDPRRARQEANDRYRDGALYVPPGRTA